MGVALIALIIVILLMAFGFGVLGFAFSASMDIWLWYGFSPHTLPALAAVLGRGLWFDVSHAAGNVVIALAAGPELRNDLGQQMRVCLAGTNHIEKTNDDAGEHALRAQIGHEVFPVQLGEAVDVARAHRAV